MHGGGRRVPCDAGTVAVLLQLAPVTLTAHLRLARYPGYFILLQVGSLPSIGDLKMDHGTSGRHDGRLARDVGALA